MIETRFPERGTEDGTRRKTGHDLYPALGTVLNVGGNRRLAVLFTPFDTQVYANVTGSTLISVIPPTTRTPTPPPTPSPTPSQLTGAFDAGRKKKALTAISIGVDEAMAGGLIVNPAFYNALGAVKKHRKTVSTEYVGIQGISFDGNHRVAIKLAKPYKGAVELMVHGGILAADGASSDIAFSEVVDRGGVAGKPKADRWAVPTLQVPAT